MDLLEKPEWFQHWIFCYNRYAGWGACCSGQGWIGRVRISFSSSIYSHVQCKVVVVVVVEPSLTNQLPFFLPLSSKAPRLERKLIFKSSVSFRCERLRLIFSGVVCLPLKRSVTSWKLREHLLLFFFYNLVWGISRKKRITILKFNTLPHPGLMAGARYAKGGQILITNPLFCLHMCKKYIEW